MMKNSIRKRISFLTKKKKRSECPTLGHDREIILNSDSDSCHSSIIERKKRYDDTLFLKQEIVSISDNIKFREKIILLKNNVNFSFTGKGKFRIIYGSVNIFGYNISSENDLNDYEFDMNKMFQLYSCNNSGLLINSEGEYEEILKFCEKFITSDNSKKVSLGSVMKFYYNVGKDKISLVYFKELSQDFKIYKNEELSNPDIDFVDFNKYKDSTAKTDLEENKKILICGKKNSGKSTFLLYSINNTLSKIKDKIHKFHSEKITNHPYLFLLDCDSGQPLISNPYTVSLIKINKPIFHNYYKDSITNSCIDYLHSNLTNSTYADEYSYDIIRSLFVEENSHLNNFSDYLNAIIKLVELFNNITDSDHHYLLINTNGYTSGLGNVINSAIIDIIKPHLTFYVKNVKAGRLEKGEEFENYILKEQEKNSLIIVLRKFKIQTTSTVTSLDINSVLIENNFSLRERRNTENKKLTKNIYIIANLIGDNFMLSNNLNWNDLLYSKNNFRIIYSSMVEYSFDDIIFSFNHQEFKPQSDLDILLAINAKLCFILIPSFVVMESFYNVKANELKQINYSDLSAEQRVFYSFGYVFNIDIKERKLIIISNKLKSISNKNKISIILHKSSSFNIHTSNIFKSVLTLKSFSQQSALFPQESKKSELIFPYHSRNKFSII